MTREKAAIIDICVSFLLNLMLQSVFPFPFLYFDFTIFIVLDYIINFGFSIKLFIFFGKLFKLILKCINLFEKFL